MAPIAAGRWFLGAASMAAGHGGIARVARLSARALVASGAKLDMLSFLDESRIGLAGQTVPTARGSRLAFLARCHAAGLRHDRFVYDSVGVARAHPKVPGWRRPYAVWIHGVEVWDGLDAARARALRGADLVLVNSQFTLERFSRLHWPLERAEICWPATEEDAKPDLSPDFHGPPSVLVLGRIDTENFYKGHKELVAAWRVVTDAVPDARLVIAGGGSGLQKLEALVAASPARASIEVRGYVPEKDLPSLWRESHVFAMPSRGEGFGLVYIEAMRHAIPVIASIHDAGREVNIDGVTGYNVDLDRPDELAGQLIHLLQSPEICASMGRAGQDRWRRNFRFSAFEGRFIDQVVT